MASSTLTIPQGVQSITINQFEPPKDRDQVQAENYADDGKGNHDLPEDLKKALKDLLTHYGTTVDKMARRYEVIDARRQRFYDRGYQYIYYNASSCVFLPITGGVVMSIGTDAVQMPRYTSVYNIYKPYRRNFAATLTQNPPGVVFEPKDPSSSLDIKSADCAIKYAEHYDVINPNKKLQSKIARLFWTDGRVVVRTIHEKNAEKFGTFQENEQEQDYKEDQSESQISAEAGVEDQLANALATDADKSDSEATQVNDEVDEEAAERDEMEAAEKNARGEEVSRVYGVLEAKCFPITADDQDGLTGTILSDDPDINRAKEKYWWIAEEIKSGESGTGETAFERNARLGVLQGMRIWAQSSDGYSQLTERQTMYLRPAAFRHNKALRARLRKIFPKGVCVTFVSGVYAEAFNVSMDEELKVDFPLDGDGMNRPSWGKDHMPVQDAYNNYRNMRQEFHDYCIPVIAYDVALLDPNSLREKISQPGEWWAVSNPNGAAVALASYFFATPKIEVPADLVEAEQDLRDALSQLITGVQSALFGGNLSAGKEADRVGVYQMAREQAMGVMGMPWGVIQGMFATMKYQAALAAGRNRRAEDNLLVMKRRRYGKPKKVSVNIGDLQLGNFRAKPDNDSSFPVTRTMKKQALQEIGAAAQASPAIAEALQQPDNLELFAELEGLSEFEIPAAVAANRQRDEIDQLLETGPIPPSRQMVEQAVQAAQLKASAALAVQASAHGQAAPGQAPPLPPEMQPPTPEQWETKDEKGNIAFIASGAWLKNPLMMSMAKCSLEPDEDDFQQYHLAELKDWWNGPERDKQVDAGNIQGLANLKMHWKIHKDMAAKEAAAAGAGQSKPPSQSINLKDLNPGERAQMLNEVGIKADPTMPMQTQPAAAAAPVAA